MLWPKVLGTKGRQRWSVVTNSFMCVPSMACQMNPALMSQGLRHLSAVPHQALPLTAWVNIVLSVPLSRQHVQCAWSGQQRRQRVWLLRSRPMDMIQVKKKLKLPVKVSNYFINQRLCSSNHCYCSFVIAATAAVVDNLSFRFAI